MKEKNINYFDYTNFFDGINNVKYWKDLTHLTNQGADIFTKEIKKMTFKP